MHCTHTRNFLTEPPTWHWMVCKFGLNTRLLMPVGLRPTPPRYFALPRQVIWLPTTGFLPQTSHCMPMADILLGAFRLGCKVCMIANRVILTRGAAGAWACGSPRLLFGL